MDTPSPRLDWFDITRYTLPAGELLAAFELLVDDGGKLPSLPPEASHPPMHYRVPTDICPTLQKMRVEVLCWGVRDMKKFQLLHVTSPIMEMECGGVKIQSEYIRDAKENPNFPNPVLPFFDVVNGTSLSSDSYGICV